MFAKQISYPFFYVDTIENNVMLYTGNNLFLAWQADHDITVRSAKQGVIRDGSTELPMQSILAFSIENVNLSSFTTVKVR